MYESKKLHISKMIGLIKSTLTKSTRDYLLIFVAPVGAPLYQALREMTKANKRGIPGSIDVMHNYAQLFDEPRKLWAC